MKGCGRWTDEIADCALGKRVAPELAAHLAVCPQCETALRDSQALAARMDEVLRRSAAAEPPVYGPQRIMARIHGQRDPRGWWRWAAAGSAVLAVSIGILTWVRRPAPEADVIALSTWRSPTQALLRPPLAAAWTTRPHLGEGFFKIKPPGEIHAR